MMQNLLDRVDIPDISPDDTDRVKLSEGNAASLLAAADKYLIPLLKSKCEEFIINHLYLYRSDKSCTV